MVYNKTIVWLSSVISSKVLLRNCLLLSFLLTPILLFSQKEVVKKFKSFINEIEISTVGLDNFVIENSETAFLEIYLFAENANAQHIVFEEEHNRAKIQFTIDEIEEEETVFRKFITKRLKRASAIVKIPKDKKVVIFGENIDITSKSYLGNLAIYIEKGNVKLDTVRGDISLKLYAGNVLATLKNTNIDVISNIGSIRMDGVSTKKHYKKETVKFTQKFSINSIKANIFLRSLKTQ